MDARERIMLLRATTLVLLVSLACGTKVDFRQTKSNKEFIGSLREGDFEIVHPFQIREKNDRIGIDTRNYFLRGSEHFEQVTVVIRSATLGRMKIVATRNDHLVLNQTAFRKLDTNGEHVMGARVENCFYQGSVAGDADSYAAFSSCNGLRGVIAFSNGSSYGIYPLDGGDRGKRHPHVLYKAAWTAEAKCGAAPSSTAAVADALVSHHKHRRDMSKQTKHVELAVIGDYQLMLERASDETDAVMYMLEAINAADLMLSRDVNVRLCIVYLELWLDVQRVDLLADSAATLAGLVDYSAGHLYNIPKDATVLFTGGRFANDETTTSSFRSICTARAATVVKAVDDFSPIWSGQLLSQSIGHILGLDHDSPACACPHCVMNAKIGSVGSPFGWQFSKCSIARMHGIWQSGHVHCLLNKPFQESTLRLCGNGMVEGSEECDCGSRESCSDPCCDPLTCTLRAHAQCAAHHACCQRCQLLPSGHTCRSSRGACDVAEQCDGRSGDCPTDGHLVDGSMCGNEGTCWRGNCSDAQTQCRSLWGRSSSVAETACFDQNTHGYEYANCGDDRPCAKADAMCGLLHCQGGEEQSLANTRSFAFSFLSGEGRSVQCKTVADAVGMVKDGTSCGPGKVCVGASCVEMAQVTAAVSCPSSNVALSCSGHGDCTTAGKCVCIEGWDGEACDSRSSAARKKILSPPTVIVPSLAAGRSLDTGTLLLILLGVGLFLLLLLVCLLFCYRRRTHVEIALPSDEKSIDAPPESQRTIKFGNMPSYREDKRKRKSNKRIYGALNRITEADERDSASLRSRESALIAEASHRGGMASSRSEVGVSHGGSNEHVYAASVIGIGQDERDVEYSIDFPSFPWRNDVHGQASPCLSRPSPLDYPPHHHSSHRNNLYSSSVSSSSFPDGAPLRLTRLLERFQYDEDDDDDGRGRSGGNRREDGDGGDGLPDPPRIRYPLGDDVMATDLDLEHAASNTESSRAGESPNQGGSSVDGSLNPQPPGGPLPFRNSPSLFSDPFRLDMSTSIHT